MANGMRTTLIVRSRVYNASGKSDAVKMVRQLVLFYVSQVTSSALPNISLQEQPAVSLPHKRKAVFTRWNRQANRWPYRVNAI